MFRVIMLPFAVYATLVAAHYGAKIHEPRKQRQLIWSTCVIGFSALASLLYGLGAFFRGFAFLVTSQALWGFGLMLIATIPCGLAFFNQKNIRPIRNLFFLALGGLNLCMAIWWLQRGWAL